MQGKVYEIPLDIANGVLTAQIRVLVTEDMGTNTFRFKVVKDNHVPYDFTGTIVRMMVKTPSGARIQQECTIENAVGGVLRITLKQSLLLEHGSYVAELQIFDAITQNIRLTTPTFTYHVRQSLQNSESIVATDEYTILQEALADLAGINIVVANKADKSDVGDVEDLTTTEKANLVSAINEVKLQSNETATEVEAHKAESVTDAHGFEYEEGVFTPQIRFSYDTVGITYQFQEGRYTRIGRVVHFEIHIQLTNKGTSIGGAQLAGMPFNPNASQPSRGYALGDYRSISVDSNTAMVKLFYNIGSGFMLFRSVNADGTEIALSNTNFTNDSIIKIAGMYTI